MPVVGELVEAGVGHHHHRVAHLGVHVAQRDLHDALGVVGRRAARVLHRGDAEQDQPADPGLGRLVGGLAQRVAGVLDHAGHRGDRLRLGRCPP